MLLKPSYEIYPLGDQGLTIEFGRAISLTLHQQVMTCYQHWQQYPIKGVHALVPAYASISIFYEPARPSANGTRFEVVKSLLEKSLQEIAWPDYQPGELIHIPVCYDPSLNPELPAYAAACQLSIEAFINLHQQQEYLVYMLGFLPGFAYMGEVDEQIALPRKKRPVPVRAGSVGIAGRQTGIYPFDSPGGWCIIGQTPLRLFDPHHTTPTLLKAGNRVRFNAISLEAFQQWKEGPV